MRQTQYFNFFLLTWLKLNGFCLFLKIWQKNRIDFGIVAIFHFFQLYVKIFSKTHCAALRDYRNKQGCFTSFGDSSQESFSLYCLFRDSEWAKHLAYKQRSLNRQRRCNTHTGTQYFRNVPPFSLFQHVFRDVLSLHKQQRFWNATAAPLCVWKAVLLHGFYCCTILTSLLSHDLLMLHPPRLAWLIIQLALLEEVNIMWAFTQLMDSIFQKMKRFPWHLYPCIICVSFYWVTWNSMT